MNSYILTPAEKKVIAHMRENGALFKKLGYTVQGVKMFLTVTYQKESECIVKTSSIDWTKTI